MRCVTIRPIDNGFVLEVPPDADYLVGQEIGFIDNEDVRPAFERLVYELADLFGMPYNKFSRDNLKITWDLPGHKVEE